MRSRTRPLLTLLGLAVPLATGAAGNAPGFPKKAGGAIDVAPAVAELSGKGDFAVVAVAGHRVVAYGTDGHGIAGFPFELGEAETAAGDVAAADMDADHRAEVAVTTTSGKLFLISGGAVVPGFPISFAEGCSSGPSFGDVDGDGLPELIQGDRAGRLHVFKKSGRELPGFPVLLGEPLSSSASVGRLKQQLAIAVGSEPGKVFVLDRAGKQFEGFPLVTHGAISGAPAFGDLDDDGKADLIVASLDFKLYAVSETGTPLPGFPVVTGLPIHGAPALADLDGDGVLEVAFASSDGALYAVKGNGNPLPGFPVQLGPTLPGGVVAGDLRRDGNLALVVAGSDGRLFAVNAAGKPVPGFPRRLATRLAATPFLAGREEAVLFVGEPDGTLVALTMQTEPGHSPESEVAWPSAGRDASRSGWFHPNPPRYKEMTLSPKEPRVEDTLKAEWRFFSVDGAPEPPAAVRWIRNDKPVKELDGKRELAPGAVHKGERWHFELKAGARLFKSATVAILNTPPTAPAIRLTPEVVNRKTGAKVEITRPSTDADGDKLTTRILWMVDGLPSSLTGDAFPGDRLKKGQRLTVVVAASDGSNEGPAATVEQTVANAAPNPPAIAFNLTAPKRADTLSVAIQKPGTDIDGDAIQYRFRWAVNGVAKNYPLGRSAVALQSFKKGDHVSVAVTSFDGVAESEPVKAEVVVANSPPLAPKLALGPLNPRAGQALRAAVAAPAVDGDSDDISYKARWTRNGKPWTGEGLEVPGTETAKGQRWSVSVTPNDGLADGPAAKAEVEIQDTPPTAPRVGLKPELGHANVPIEVEIQRDSEDVDGDPVKYAFAWSVDGKPVAGGKDKKRLSPGEFKKHQRVQVTVTPSDGSLEGPAGLKELQVENSPPGAPGVRLDPAKAVARVPLKAVIDKPASDVDGDALSYSYRWFKNGVPQPYAASLAEVPAAEVKKGDRWTVVVQANDGEAPGPPTSASTQVGNTPPPTPTVAFNPERPRRGQGLRAVVGEVVDVDGDPVSCRFAWRRDGKPLPLPKEASIISGDDPQGPKKGELWSVDVVATDGEAESSPAHAEVRIADTPPTPAAVSLCDGSVRVGTALETKLVSQSTDADGDAISYDYAWTVDGKSKAAWAGRKGLGGGDFHKHEVLRVAVTPSDGTEKGPGSAAECLVEDTAPAAPTIALEPPEPSAGTGVRVRIAKEAVDADGDKVTYRYHWTRNGLALSSAGGPAVGPGELKRGDVVSVTVTAFDGEAEGGQVSAAATVRNTPPPVPKVTLSPEKPATASAVKCGAEVPGKDVDGDPIQVHRTWWRGDQPFVPATEQAALPAGIVRRGEKWGCEAWSDDGFATSAHARADVTVVHSPPTAPEIAIEPEKPGGADEIICRIASEALDADGDPIEYRYQWARNGKAMPAGADPARLAPGRARRGEKWACTVRAFDGTLEGPPATVERTILNSPPTAAGVAIDPSSPVAGQTLTCAVREPSTDPDGDAVTYRFAWFKDGVQQSFAASSVEVPGRLVHAKDLWRCQVQPSDGDLEGRPTSSSDIAVQGDRI